MRSGAVGGSESRESGNLTGRSAYDRLQKRVFLSREASALREVTAVSRELGQSTEEGLR
jgi:hypothetical protein